METEDYQARLKALGIDRGKLETGFVDPEMPSTVTSRHEPSNDGKMTVQPTVGPPPKVSEKLPTFSDKRVVNNSVNKCRCGVTIYKGSKSCKACRFKIQREQRGADSPSAPPETKSVTKESLSQVDPSPPPALPPPPKAAPKNVTFALYLDAREARQIVISAPLEITRQELKRIQSWIGLQLIIEDSTEWDYVI